jgi:hypothetical protein
VLDADGMVATAIAGAFREAAPNAALDEVTG